MKVKSKPGPAVELKITEDGSDTLFVPGLKEHYHSVFGAIAESRHIYLEAGFRHVYKPTETIRILEIGFGTGLNALLTCIESEISGCYVEYTAIELYPLNEEIFSRFNFYKFLNFPDTQEIFQNIHKLPWNEWCHPTNHFSLHKINISLEDYQPEKETFDLIYFDAFGPTVQPEMWTKEVFNKMSFVLRKQGVLVTYSTKGTVKRNLKEAGFSIEKLPGPAGKREILRATRISSYLTRKPL
jgi:tRNA U34 5-methylaminomethyl-2-thiouridine-forming methyltransferase MnmC